MAETATTNESAQIHILLAEHGYEVTDTAPNVLSIKQLDSGISIQAVMEGEIVYFSLMCQTVPESKLTQGILRRMLASDNGISTSYFQLYDFGEGQTTIALCNFCKLAKMGDEDADDILSCVHFLFADVLTARDLLRSLE
jgi:hypothetical protein